MVLVLFFILGARALNLFSDHFAKKKTEKISRMYPCLMVFSWQVGRVNLTNRELVSTQWNTKSKNYLFMRCDDKKNFARARTHIACTLYNPENVQSQKRNNIFFLSLAVEMRWFYLDFDVSEHSRLWTYFVWLVLFRAYSFLLAYVFFLWKKV